MSRSQTGQAPEILRPMVARGHLGQARSREGAEGGPLTTLAYQRLMVANIAQAVRTRLSVTDVRLTVAQADALCEFIRAEATEAV